MSHEVLSVVSQVYPRGGGERMLAFVLADFARPTGDRIYPSVATLATRTMQSARTVQRGLCAMVESGWLQVVQHASGGRGNTTEYRICPKWLDDAAMEVALARQGRREPRPVAVQKELWVESALGEQGDALDPLKGDKLSPFTETLKGDKKHLKGDKNGLKGDTAMSPEQRTENREEPPYPPMGGERDFFADIESAYPAKRTHNLKAARRVFAGVFGASPDPDRVAACVEAIGREAASTEWMRDGGRWVPKLSVWLAGWALQTHQPEAGAVLVDAARETVERLAANAGLSAPPSAQVMAGLAALRGQMGGRSW